MSRHRASARSWSTTTAADSATTASVHAPTWSGAPCGAYWTFTQTVSLVIDHFAIPLPTDERARLLAYDNFLMDDEPSGAGI